MIRPKFIFDAEANGWLSEPFAVEGQATVYIELAAMAPVVTLKQEDDGEYSMYGQTPDASDRYEIQLRTDDAVMLKLATPVEITKCYILN